MSHSQRKANHRFTTEESTPTSKSSAAASNHVKFLTEEQEQQQQRQTFPFKLYDMLEYAHNHNAEFSSSLSWLPNGNGFFIHNSDALMNDLAPKFFHQTKFQSFTRQLNIWGFVRTNSYEATSKSGGWSHEHFLRGRTDLLKEIVRTEIKSKSAVKGKKVKVKPSKLELKRRSSTSTSQNTIGKTSSVRKAARVKVNSAIIAATATATDDALPAMYSRASRGSVFQYFSTYHNVRQEGSANKGAVSPSLSSSSSSSGRKLSEDDETDQPETQACIKKEPTSQQQLAKNHMHKNFDLSTSIISTNNSDGAHQSNVQSFNNDDFLTHLDSVFDKDANERLSYEDDLQSILCKAMEKDTTTPSRMPGVFVDLTDTSRDEFDKIVARSVMNTSNSENTLHMKLMNIESAQARSHGFGEHSSSATGSAPSSKRAEKEAPLSLYSASNDANFKHAAPFLSGAASYIERNSIPFEHIDVWVPSYVDGTSSMGTGSKSQSNFRLCFGGSATMGVKIVSNAANGNGNSQKPSMKRTPLNEEDKTNFSMFGTYSENFSFDSGCGLPGRVFQSGVPVWEQFVSEAHPSMFERRGGAVQFGIKSALGIPIKSPNVGRVVLVMYSKYDRAMGRLMNDLKLLCPFPRWKLVVDVGPANGVKAGKSCPSSLHQPPAIQESPDVTVSPPSPRSVNRQDDEKNKLINDLSNLLDEQIPLDMNSALGQQIHGIMSLRLVLLRQSRTSEEEALVSTILVLYESYLLANRSGQDIACMLARDFCFFTCSMVFSSK